PGKLSDAATGQALADRPADLAQVRLNNRLRGTIETALGTLTLLSKDPNTRFVAAQAVFKSHNPAVLPLLDKALAQETDARVKRAMEEARAAIVVNLAGATDPEKIA